MVNVVYEWGYNAFRGDKFEDRKQEIDKNPETIKEIVKKDDQMKKESQSEAVIIENIT